MPGKVRDLPYRPCVGLMLVNPAGQIWVGRRVGTQDSWQMPQGGIDRGESPAEAALREMEEEIGTDQAEIVYESQAWYRYDLPDRLIGRVWRGRYRGQEQRWFLLRFTGAESDIDIDTDHPEFDEWRWVSVESLLELIVPFKREVYEQVVAEFRPQLDLLTRA